MQVIEDLPTRQAFEERESGCIPKGAIVNDDSALVVVLLVIVAVVAALIAYEGFQLIRQGNIKDTLVRETLISALISLAFAVDVVASLWRRPRRHLEEDADGIALEHWDVLLRIQKHMIRSRFTGNLSLSSSGGDSNDMSTTDLCQLT